VKLGCTLESDGRFDLFPTANWGKTRLLSFQTERVDILGSRIAEHEWCVRGVKPKPHPSGSRRSHILRIGNQLRIPTRDGDSENTRPAQ
jgi:hypothetical protein